MQSLRRAAGRFHPALRVSAALPPPRTAANPLTSSSSTAAVPMSSSSTPSAATPTPSHHDPKGSGFRNPPEWGSYVDHGPLDFFTQALPEWRRLKEYALPIRAIDWEAIRRRAPPPTTFSVQCTWIGHVTFLLQLGGRTVLTDPVFSAYASPVQFAGPRRFTPPACQVEDLPPIDAVCVSHNHYDHLDYRGVVRLIEKEAKDLASAAPGFSGTTFFVPLGLKATLDSFGVRPARVVELDWWQSSVLEAPGAGAGAGAGVLPLTVTAVPAQHQSARTIWDRNATLWCGFTFEVKKEEKEGGLGASPAPDSATTTPGRVAVYFSGDTGYRSVPSGTLPYSEAETTAVTCPAFREIGARLGPFDLALLPIGAYSPRTFMSSFHASPEDAVEMHGEVRSRKSVGMHWGTFPLTDEPIEEPPRRLAEAARRKGLADEEFVALEHGETVRV
jgi:N-acyl-phosphatidylethanolamine-hydrolysing phospholipase D